MGWRVSWYKADKNEPLILTTEDGWTWPKINGEEVVIESLKVEKKEKVIFTDCSGNKKY